MSLLIRMAIAASVAIAASACGGSESESVPNFRNVRWYDSIETVKANEIATFLEHRKHELNVAATPQEPWEVEHLYFKDTLIGKPVKVLYRFDLDCKQLYEAGYIFEEVLSPRNIELLLSAIEEKFDIKLKKDVSSDKLFANGQLDEETNVGFNEQGLLHFHNDVSVLYYQTTNYHWMVGWKDGAEPTCSAKDRAKREVQEKL